MKKSMIVGLVGSMMFGAGYMIYNYILSPKTKRKLMSLEEDMCNDFKNMTENREN